MYNNTCCTYPKLVQDCIWFINPVHLAAYFQCGFQECLTSIILPILVCILVEYTCIEGEYMG